MLASLARAGLPRRCFLSYLPQRFWAVALFRQAGMRKDVGRSDLSIRLWNA